MRILHNKSIEGELFLVDHRIIESPGGDAFTSHIHEAWELLFFIRGDVSYKVEGRSYTLSRGDLVLSRPSVFHHIEPISNALYERYNVILDGSMIPKSIRNAIPEGVDVFSFGASCVMFDLFEKIETYSEKFSGEDLELLIKGILTEIVYNLAIEGGYTAPHTSQNPLMSRALSYIEENLTVIKKIDEICEKLYITKSHLHHLFVKALGITPKKYINTKRLLLAQKLMRRGMSATEAASAVGYEDYATFFRNYKKHFGYSPSEEIGKVRLTPAEI